MRYYNYIGILFSTVPYYYDYHDTLSIKNFAHLNYSSIITDTANWTIISGSFISDSSYKYINIGNFFDDNNTDNTDTTILHNNCQAYYYIDCICVSIDSMTCILPDDLAETNSANAEFNVYPNPSMNEISIDINENYKNINVIFFDLLGKKYKEITIPPNAKQININDFYQGIYFMQLNIDNKIFYKKIIINH